jgi:hypothetical protein
LALSGLAALFTWGSICLAHIRFRAAWKHQGHTLDEIPFKAIGGVYGSWCGLILIFLVLMAQVSISPTQSPKVNTHRITNYSSIRLFTPLATMAKSAPPKTSSNPTSRFRLCSSSGLAAISGNARGGLEHRKLTSTLEEERSIGIASMPQEPRLLHILLGGEFITSCSKLQL